MESVVASGETIEDAIKAGLERLGVSPSEVMVEVLEEPTPASLFDEEAKPAQVRLVLIGGRRPEPPPNRRRAAPPQPSRSSSGRRGRDRDRDRDRGNRSSRRSNRPPREDRFDPPAEDEIPDEEADEIAITGKSILTELLEKMGMDETHVGIRKAESTRQDEEMHWILNISGKNMNRLIGRRGETLSSLQYITRLIISRQMQRRANIIVDAAQYKSRRSDRLRQLANRMAEQALSQNRTVSLEPMPPHERRIIHLSLRGRDDVTTKSIGEGKSRKVTISPTE